VKKSGLKHNIQKTKIMASGPITSWKKAEAVADLNFLGSKITVDGDCSHEITKHLLLGRKAMAKLHICSLFDLAILLLRIYPNNMVTKSSLFFVETYFFHHGRK